MNASLPGIAKGRPKGWKFWAKLSVSLAFLLVVLTFFLLPDYSDSHSGLAQNESAAMGGLRTLNNLENQYAAAHADQGFACDLALLQPTEEMKEAYGPYATLLSGAWSGYNFAVVGCVTGTNGGVIHYAMTAVPISRYGTGVRAFCSDESGSIFYDRAGSGAECLSARRLLP
jgi:hypothetical protein